VLIVPWSGLLAMDCKKGVKDGGTVAVRWEVIGHLEVIRIRRHFPTNQNWVAPSLETLERCITMVTIKTW